MALLWFYTQTWHMVSLKTSCNMKSETTWMNILYSVTFIFFDLSCTLNESFIHACFIICYTAHLETLGSKLCKTPNVDIFYSDKIKIIKIINVTTNFIWKLLVQEAIKLTVTNTKFMKVNFHLNTGILPLAANIISCFSSSKTFLSFTFKKMSNWVLMLRCTITELRQEAYL